mmetsp:Transcript_144140/g.461460  ORF Transcript_144140/g.461460 Transcript_144140/m.461460 type:complete len:407 (-) Transcript_144140:10-1230(-)
MLIQESSDFFPAMPVVVRDRDPFDGRAQQPLDKVLNFAWIDSRIWQTVQCKSVVLHERVHIVECPLSSCLASCEDDRSRQHRRPAEQSHHRPPPGVGSHDMVHVEAAAVAAIQHRPLVESQEVICELQDGPAHCSNHSHEDQVVVVEGEAHANDVLAVHVDGDGVEGRSGMEDHLSLRSVPGGARSSLDQVREAAIPVLNATRQRLRVFVADHQQCHRSAQARHQQDHRNSVKCSQHKVDVVAAGAPVEAEVEAAMALKTLQRGGILWQGRAPRATKRRAALALLRSIVREGEGPAVLAALLGADAGGAAHRIGAPVKERALVGAQPEHVQAARAVGHDQPRADVTPRLLHVQYLETSIRLHDATGQVAVRPHRGRIDAANDPQNEAERRLHPHGLSSAELCALRA